MVKAEAIYLLTCYWWTVVKATYTAPAELGLLMVKAAAIPADLLLVHSGESYIYCNC
jgi:hypothetical protein